MPVVTPAGGQAEGSSVSKNTFNVLVASLLGSEQPNPNLASLNAGARDCQSREVLGAQFVLMDGETNPPSPVPVGTTVGSTRVIYLKNNLPNAVCTYTTNAPRAVWAMVNAPVNAGPGVAPHTYTIRMLGRMTAADKDPVVIDEHPVESYPGEVTILRSGRYSASFFH
jgi:hypothetical protein